MATIYSDYSRARLGFIFGFSGWQVSVVALTFLPIAGAVSVGAWPSVALFGVLWLAISALTLTPVRGRSAVGWLHAALTFAFGGLTGWTSFRAKATSGKTDNLDEPDLPGVLQGVTIHDGPPQGATFSRIAIIQDHRARTWALTAAIVHPGIGLSEAEVRERHGHGLSELIDLAARTEMIDEILFLVRTVPEDGAERNQWIARHRRADGPSVARRINDEIQANLTRASVRSEAFVTFVVPEGRLARDAKESGGGLDGRARVLYSLAGELEAQLRGGMGMTSVNWLTSPELALACRTGFAPGDRATIIDALAEKELDPEVNAEVPWAMAGPSGADPVARHYSHDAWNSISSTIKLPAKGALMGSLAGVLTPTEPGERRSFTVAYPILSQAAAQRQSATSEWAADIGEELNNRARRKQRASSRAEAEKVRGLDAKIARGNALTRPYAVCTVTVPKTQRVAAFGRNLDASIRRAGFAPLRLDLAQDVAFAATNVPLGVSLTRKAN
ncbi:SCO6880 family protein [Janibacter sp. GXQ6167]|uniref:SCO6880 family protein n=1 Tax=Janibacter sp. GXQ6167 TaxID=3240791 RepID=UPI003526472A